jgi:nucleotide-binding universal stress UspA family protein
MKKLLVPTDFSSNANNALDLAVQIAKQAKAEIFLIHSCQLLSTTLKDRLALKKEYNRNLLNKANKKLAELKNRIENNEKITVNTTIYNGSATDCILEAAEEIGVDFIIIGTRGETELIDRILGSTTAGILGETKVPLIVVSPLTKLKTIKAAAEPGTIGSEKCTPDAILFATNHFEQNKELLKPIVDMARLFFSTVHVAVFVDTDDANGYEYVYNMGELNHYLKFLKETYPDVAFKAELLEGEDFESTLEKYNDDNGIDIIATVTYPKSFLDKLLKKKVTLEMAYHSKVPVMAISGKNNQA